MAEGVPQRDRWSSRTTFILGAIGSAVGLGNLWRFPYLVFAYGGGSFLIPYFITLMFFGVPILLMELTLGRQFQGGDPVCFSAMHPRMVGIGWMSAFGAFLLAVYYAVIVAWIVIFFFNSFRRELPWALEEDAKGLDGLNDALDFYFGNILRIAPNDTTQSTMNPQMPAALLFVWVVVFFSIWRGVGLVSQVVKVSVPVPIITLIILLVNNIGREGASDGINAYVGQWSLDVIADAQIWQDAVGQVFFSIGICFGVMTAYSSYVESRKGLFTDALMIALLDSAISFFAGFVVFTAVGVLAGTLGLDFDDENFQGRIRTFSLVFVAYPSALTTLGSNANVFSAIFFLTLFFLAIDSAFSIVEGIVAAVHDTDFGSQYRREGLTLAICIALFVFGIFFTLDNGLYMLDVVDNYLNNYIMLAVGGLECVAATWIFGMKDSSEELGTNAILVWSISYFVASLSAPLAIIFLPYYRIWIGFFLWIILSMMGFFAALSLANPVPNKIYRLLFSGGAKKLMNIMAEDEYDSLDRVTIYYSTILHIWGFMCKYLLPYFLLMLTLTGAALNFESPYEGYNNILQNIGQFLVVVAFGIFFTFVFFKVDAYSNKRVQWQEYRAAREGFEVAEKDEEVPMKVDEDTVEVKEDSI